MLRLLRSAAVAAAVLMVADSATAFWIMPNPIAFDQNGVKGTITLVEFVTGAPVGADVVFGPVDGTMTSLGYQIFVENGSVNEISTSLFLKTSKGAGRVLGGGVDVDSVAGTASARLFKFYGVDPGGTSPDMVDAGETSDTFWVAYATTDVAALVNVANQVTFMVSPNSTSADFTVTATIIPEPGTLGLLALGVAGLLLARSR